MSGICDYTFPCVILGQCSSGYHGYVQTALPVIIVGPSWRELSGDFPFSYYADIVCVTLLVNVRANTKLT